MHAHRAAMRLPARGFIAMSVGVACCFAAAAAQVLSGALSTLCKRSAILACGAH